MTGVPGAGNDILYANGSANVAAITDHDILTGGSDSADTYVIDLAHDRGTIEIIESGMGLDELYLIDDLFYSENNNRIYAFTAALTTEATAQPWLRSLNFYCIEAR